MYHVWQRYGTGGTLNGVGRVLRARSPSTKIHVCEPDNAPLLYSDLKTAYPADGGGQGHTQTGCTPHTVHLPSVHC